MSFQHGLSGLNAASKNLDTIGNNVANSSTVGFKSGQTIFADVYANALTGAGGAQTGIGVKVAQVAQQFTQGNITTSNNTLDVAINGNGFFRMSDNGAITYSRNGQFQLDDEGYIINANGSRLTGYMADASGVLSAGAPTELNINTADLNPLATTEVNAVLNLDSTKPIITATFNSADSTTFSSSTAVTAYDTLGNSHVLQTYYVKTAANEWDVYLACDGTVVDGVTGGTVDPITTLNFTSAGALSTGSPVTAIPAITVTTGAAALDFDIDFAGTTQFGSDFSVNSLTQDGYTSGSLSGFTIADDGIINGRYTNGQSAVLGQVVLASFSNPNGLQPLGNNLWAETSASGQPLINAPGAGNAGVLQSNAVEDSNVDLTAELVNMITAQRYYQANAQTIKTQDEVMQTLVNL